MGGTPLILVKTIIPLHMNVAYKLDLTWGFFLWFSKFRMVQLHGAKMIL